MEVENELIKFFKVLYVVVSSYVWINKKTIVHYMDEFALENIRLYES